MPQLGHRETFLQNIPSEPLSAPCWPVRKPAVKADRAAFKCGFICISKPLSSPASPSTVGLL